MDYTKIPKNKIISFSKLNSGEIFTFNENYKSGLYGFKKGYPYLFLDSGGTFRDDYIYSLRTNILMKVPYESKPYLKVRKLKYKLKISE